MTYSGDPSTSLRDAVRFLVGDTEPEFLLKDPEIDWLLTEFDEHSVFCAAAVAADIISGKFAEESGGSISADGMSISATQAAGNFSDLAEHLRRLCKRRGRLGLPYVGGISWKERIKADQDSDKIPTHFRSHMHDHPDTGTTRPFYDPLRPSQ